MNNIQDLLSLKEKVTIVTGASKGIGYSIAQRLAEAGANVILADIDQASLIKAVETLSSRGLSVFPETIDVSSEIDIKKLIDDCQTKFGRLDILINNAGIYPSKPITSMSLKDFDKVINTNLRSVFLTTKYGSELMKKHGGGKIINISSVDAIHPSMIGLAHYDASKHGVWGFTKNSALELAEYNITVNAIAPGGINTPGAGGSSSVPPSKEMLELAKQFIAKIPMKRMGEPDDIGKVALFLASDMSSYMTGSQIVVDGGVLLK